MLLLRWYKGVLQKYHIAINNFFSGYGSFIARKPYISLLVGVVVLGCLCIGLLHAHKEKDIENLWVEQNSRVVPEKKFFDSHFGGLPRKEGATINLKASLEANITDFRQALDALIDIVKPLYSDDLSWNVSLGPSSFQLNAHDFCEKPQVPTFLRSGEDPLKSGNWIAWGYQHVSQCVLARMERLNPSINHSNIGLPQGWGFDTFPCFKLTPMDCFMEGKDLDYPKALELLEQKVQMSSSFSVPLNQLVFGYENATNFKCLDELNTLLQKNFQQMSPFLTSKIMTGVKFFITLAATWGYNWRPSYKNMSNLEILDHFNGALNFARMSTQPISDPLVQECIVQKKPCCVSWFGVPIPLEAAFGSVTSANNTIEAIGALRWGANNWHHNHPLWIEYITNRLNATHTSEEQRKELVLGWENILIDKLKPLRDNENGTNFAAGEKFQELQVQFSMWRSSEDVLADANRTPIWQLILSSVLVSLYAFIAFVNFRDPVHSHTWLVLTGMVVVVLAIVAGFGLTAALGIKFTPLAGSVVPFLTLGLGIDDIFVLVNILRNYLQDERLQATETNYKSTIPEHEMRLTLALAGPSVILTTLSVLASFFISSVNPMPIVRWFCWQMGITATLHTLGMLLIFMPLMSIDARRVKSKIVDPYLWLLCGLHTKESETPIAIPEAKAAEDLAFQDHAASSPLSIAVAKFYAPLFNSNIFKTTVVIIFAAFFGVMTYLGFWKVQHGLKLSEVTLKGSYQHDYAVVTEDRFPIYDIWLVTQNIPDYSKAQSELLKLYNATQYDLSYWMPSQPKVLEFSWLGNLYLGTDAEGLSYPIPPGFFPGATKIWATSPLGVFSLHDLYCENRVTQEQMSCFDEDPSDNWTIGATKSAIFAEHLGSDTDNNLNMMTRSREVLDDFNQQNFNGTKVAYMYGYPFLFYEQYLHSSHDLYLVVGFALVGVFLAVLFFQFSITISILIVVVLLMVDIEVYGFLYILDAKLNSLSLVNLGIVVGMAAEFTYLARSFLLVDGTRNYRVGKALEWTLEPLLHGFGTQVAATFPLIFLKFHAFRLYYFAMFTMMGVLGLLNGFVLLPVLLTWFGPPPLPHVVKHQSKDEYI